MILEGIVTSSNDDGSTNIAPMGPIYETVADPDSGHFLLRPFRTSQTSANLRRHPFGVLHFSDDVMLFAQAAIGHWEEVPQLLPGHHVDVRRIENAHCALEFEANWIDIESERGSAQCKVLFEHNGPRWSGFNRARNAILEAAILATRINLLPVEDISRQFVELQSIVDKTGGQREQTAFKMLQEFVARNR